MTSNVRAAFALTNAYYYDKSNNSMSDQLRDRTLICPKCNYEWKPRVDKPVSCPECKHRLKLAQVLGLTGVGGVLQSSTDVDPLRELTVEPFDEA
jgi:hydrogenase maturation factor HypF (carbamoyltransferase family)